LVLLDLAAEDVVVDTTALVLLAILWFLAFTDARATIGVLAATCFADVDAAKGVEGKLLTRLLFVPGPSHAGHLERDGRHGSARNSSENAPAGGGIG
jgi:hypothetical protein